MPSFKRGFTLIELLVVIAIIAILAAILFPVFAQAKAAAKQTASLSNIKQASLAAIQYAGDYDDRIPRMDNNGSCYYGDNPCATPDWGDARNDSRDPNGRPMFANVIQPYIKNFEAMYIANVGKTDWQTAASRNQFGINWGGPYDKNREDIYYGIVGHYAVNLLLIERWGINCALGGISKPAETLMLADSVWGNGTEKTLKIGNTGVWPNMPRSRCFQWQQGWTWYNYRSLSNAATRAATESGMANVAWADGHVKPAKYRSLEGCNFNTENNVWVYTFWDPRY